MTKMVAMPIYVKTFKKILFFRWPWNLAHSKMTLHWPNIFYNKVNFVHLGFYIGNSWKKKYEKSKFKEMFLKLTTNG